MNTAASLLKYGETNSPGCNADSAHPTGLRRFPSPHSSLFFSGFLVEFSGSNEDGRGGWILYKGGYPGRPRGGDRPPFFSRDLVANLKKKITLRACRPLEGRPGGIFEIFQNGHIFLKFLFFKKYKKEKNAHFINNEWA